MKKIFMLFAAAAFVFSGCQYDDDDLWNAVKDQEKRLAALEKTAQQRNDEITAINNILSGLEKNDWITGVTALPDGNGYTIAFDKQAPITITNGENGQDGDSSIIGVTEVDGVYYWTLNGEMLTDATGNDLPVTGAPGKDAIAPQVRINNTTMEWEVSTDGGTYWASTGVVAQGKDGQDGQPGTDGESLFQSVDTESDPNSVTFVLTGGTTITVPRVAAPVPVDPANLQAEIDAAAEGDVILLGAGTIVLTEPIVVDKAVTIVGAMNRETHFQVSGAGVPAFKVLAPATLDRLTIEKTDLTDDGSLGIIYIQAVGAKILNSEIFGGYVTEPTFDYSYNIRAFMVATGSVTTIDGNIIRNVVNPSYTESDLTITNNQFSNTRGFVVTNNHDIVMTGNTCDQATMICLLSVIDNLGGGAGTDPEIYTDTRMDELHTANGNARVMNEIISYDSGW